MSSGVKVLEGFHKGFGAINDIGLLLAPAMLRNKVIVLDDIERKHAKLNVEEVMGFIDEFTQRHGARIVLILNSDQLADKEMWDTLREKVSVSRRSSCVKTSSARDGQAFRYIKVAIGPKTFSTSSNDALFKSRY